MGKHSAVRKRADEFIRNNYPIILLVLFFFIIKALYLFKAHNVIWDEAVYLGMGKWLFSGGSIGFWEIIRPIGLPLIVGMIWKSGLGLVFFAELVALLFATGSIFVTYLIGKEIFDEKTGFIGASILAITSVFFLYSNYILTEIPSTFFILVGIYLYVKKKSVFLAGFFCGLGALFKFPQLLIFGVFSTFFLILLIWKRKVVFF